MMSSLLKSIVDVVSPQTSTQKRTNSQLSHRAHTSVGSHIVNQILKVCKPSSIYHNEEEVVRGTQRKGLVDNKFNELCRQQIYIIMRDFNHALNEKRVEDAENFLNLARNMRDVTEACFPELEDFISINEEILVEAYHEKEFSSKLKKVIHILLEWSPTKMEKSQILPHIEKMRNEGLKHKISNNFYFFVLDLWFQYLSDSLASLETCKYNSLRFLNQIKSHRDFPHIPLSPSSQLRMVSYPTLEIPVPVLVEKSVYDLYKVSNVEYLKKKSERDIELKVLSHALVNQQDLNSILTNSPNLQQEDHDRVQKIRIFIRNGLDYSFLLNRNEKTSILEAVEKYQQHFSCNFHGLSLMEKASIVSTRFQIDIKEESSILPEILFFGEEIQFTSKICKLESKCFILELNSSVKLILDRLHDIKHSKETSNVHCREVFTESLIGSTKFASGMDQIVRKRIIPLFERILVHRLKSKTNPCEILFKRGDEPRISGFMDCLKKYHTKDQLWYQNSDNFDKVRFRMIACFALNQRCVTDMFDAIFRSVSLRDTYERTSFMRRKETQAALLKVGMLLDKCGFTMNLSLERNEYNSEAW